MPISPSLHTALTQQIAAAQTRVLGEDLLKNDAAGALWARWQGQPASAHRIAWTLTYGLIPAQKRVIPTCHNLRCCNPAHLTLVATRTPNPQRQRTPTQRTSAKAPPANRGPVVSQLRAELAQLRAELAQLKADQTNALTKLGQHIE